MVLKMVPCGILWSHAVCGSTAVCTPALLMQSNHIDFDCTYSVSLFPCPKLVGLWPAGFSSPLSLRVSMSKMLRVGFEC